MSAPCRVCGRPLDDCGTCVCATFPGPRPAPVPWSWVTETESADLRAALQALRGAEVTHGVRSWPPVDVRGYLATAAILANVVEELLVELRRRRPRADEAQEDVALHLGGARAGLGAAVELICVCKEPGCGTSFSWHPGLDASRNYCFFHSQPTTGKEPS